MALVELEKPRVTEIQVRMDCNGCVQKIKRALYGINGIYDLYIDVPQQKLTVIGWADPEKIVKAIRKTRKIATICSHTEPSNQPADSQPAEPPQEPPEGGAPPQADPSPPPADPSPPQAEAPPAEPPVEPPQPPPEEKPSPSPIAAETNASQPQQPQGLRDVGEVHAIYHHQPPDYSHGYGPYGHIRRYGEGQWNQFPNGQGPMLLPHQPVYVAHSYNTHRPSPYVTEYEYIQPPQHTVYSRPDHYSEDYRESTRNGNITSMFSDENPNACTIV